VVFKVRLEISFVMSSILKVFLICIEYILLINCFNKIKLNALFYHCMSSYAELMFFLTITGFIQLCRERFHHKIQRCAILE